MHRRIFQLIACASLVFPAVLAQADDWPQWRGPERDGVWRETRVRADLEEPLEYRWRVPVGAGYSGPTTADVRVSVTDRLVEPEQVERIHCFDLDTGRSLWSRPYACAYVDIGYQAGPRAAVSVVDGRAFALGSMGHLHCLDAGTGVVLWKRDLNEQYKIRMPIWGISASPLTAEGLVIVHIGGEKACIVAFDQKNGDEVWTALTDRAQYAAPILLNQAGKQVVVCWTGDSVAGLELKTGEVLWRHPFAPSRMPIGVATPVYNNGNLFMTSFYDGSLMLRLNSNEASVEKVWEARGEDERHTEAIHSIISTPIYLGDHVYGVDSYGELRCLEAKTGRRVWEDQTATPKARWSTIHFVLHEPTGNVWMLNERGELLITRLSPKGIEEIGRQPLLEPTTEQLRQRGGVCWSHPAFADRCVFARNDKELVCAELKD